MKHFYLCATDNNMHIVVGLVLFVSSFVLYALHYESLEHDGADEKYPQLHFAQSEWFARMAFAVAVAAVVVMLWPVLLEVV